MIFLSYSRQDAATAGELTAALELRGHEVWRDTSDIPGGRLWREAISRAILDAQAVVVLLSAKATDSESVARELSLADEMDKLIVPVLIDQCDVRVGRLAYTLSGIQLIDSSSRPIADAVADIEAALPVTSSHPPGVAERAAVAAPSRSNPATATTTAGPRHGRALVGGALAVLALATAVTLWLRRDGSPDDGALATTEPPAERFEGDSQPPPSSSHSTGDSSSSAAAQDVATVSSRSGSCTAATCAGEPIAFVIEPADASVTSVRLTDPSGFPVESAQPPTLTVSTLEWRWSAGYSDPIGEYTVVFVVDGEEQPPQTFRVEATDGPFGVVQQLAVAVAGQDWERAASIDARFARDLAAGGERSPEQQYANFVDQHWIPSDPSGRVTDEGTSIIGAFVAVDVNATPPTTELFCERWTVLPGDTSMDSEAFPAPHEGIRDTMPDAPGTPEIEAWVHANCIE